MSYAFVAAAVVAVVGAVAAGKAQKNAQEYQAQVDEQNGLLARRNAGSNEEQQRKRARAFQGRQLAAIGESGVGMTGSAADIFKESLYSAEMDALNIRYEGELGNVSAQNSAQGARYSGKLAQQAGYFGAAASIAGGAGKGYANYNKPKAGSLN
ncbi:MAG: hypothetical protein K0Q92_606 [Steroidobacteraceae bacterium]|jgi:hypothetical protein|nr:hypothetical protein [Steroidobacteraceae bacterium]